VVSRRAIDSTYFSRIETGKIQPSVRMAMMIASALRVSPCALMEPSPTKHKHQPCPVSPSGHCLMDLLELDEEVGKTKRFTPRQLRLIRRFTTVAQEGNRDLVNALEVLIGNVGRDYK
jgi:transcriptional regulator with XRE-family HTH domain